MSQQPDDNTKYVVGLGNPGRQYANTRHNVGFEVVQALVRTWQAQGPREAFGGRMYDARVTRGDAQKRVMLLEPQTYMNCSGRSVRQLADFYKVQPQDLLIVLDDMALELGQLRARADGSAGSHNGLVDIVTAMGTTKLPRLRIGIGSPPGRMDWKDFVLSTFRSDETDVIGPTIQQAAGAVEDWVFRGMTYVMDRYNRKVDKDE